MDADSKAFPVNDITNDLIEEISKSIAKAKDIHGDRYTYKAINGTKVDLRKLASNQRVCSGGNTWHILMTETT